MLFKGDIFYILEYSEIMLGKDSGKLRKLKIILINYMILVRVSFG